MTSKLEEQGSTFRSQMKSKENEVVILQKDINKLRADYERLVEIKQALALEISIYKNIIEGEEKRIKKWVKYPIILLLKLVFKGEQEDEQNEQQQVSV